MSVLMVFHDLAGVSGGRVPIITFGVRHLLAFDPLAGESGGEYVGRDGARAYLGFAAIAGISGGSAAPTRRIGLVFDDIAGVSDARPPHFRGLVAMFFGELTGISDGREVNIVEQAAPTLSQNPPIELSAYLSGRYLVYPPAGP